MISRFPLPAIAALMLLGAGVCTAQQTIRCTGPRCTICYPGSCVPSLADAEITQSVDDCPNIPNIVCSGSIAKTEKYWASWPDGYNSQPGSVSGSGASASSQTCQGGYLERSYRPCGLLAGFRFGRPGTKLFHCTSPQSICGRFSGFLWETDAGVLFIRGL